MLALTARSETPLQRHTYMAELLIIAFSFNAQRVIFDITT
jgi:hypothetical protein